MNCDLFREGLAAFIEGCASDDERREGEAHLRECAECEAERRRVARLRERLFTLASSAPQVDLRDRVLGRIAEERLRLQGRGSGILAAPGGWRGLFLDRRLGLAAAGLAAATIAALAGVLLYTPSPAWAIEKCIEAARAFRGVHVSGVIEGQDIELWIRSGAHESQMRDLLARIGDDLTIRVKGNQTFYYSRAGQVVYADDAQTAGFYPWPGPELLKWVRAVGINRVSYSHDPATGGKRVVVESSFTDVKGPQSFVLEFDASTNLLVGIRQWTNLRRSGPPSFVTRKIEFFEDLPDDAFAFEPPAGVPHFPKEVSVATELLGLLALPQYGLPAAGLSEAEASRRIVEEMWKALIGSDWARFRQLCPATASWSDEALKVLIEGADGEGAASEVLEIGQPSRRGQSPLGPLVVVPSKVRHRGGGVFEEKMIVQFRPPDDAPSCVLYGPYGAPYRID